MNPGDKNFVLLGVDQSYFTRKPIGAASAWQGSPKLPDGVVTSYVIGRRAPLFLPIPLGRGRFPECVELQQVGQTALCDTRVDGCDHSRRIEGAHLRPPR